MIEEAKNLLALMTTKEQVLKFEDFVATLQIRGDLSEREFSKLDAISTDRWVEIDNKDMTQTEGNQNERTNQND